MKLILFLFLLFLVFNFADEYEETLYDDYYDHDVSGLLEED